jgi:hypothetical protein
VAILYAVDWSRPLPNDYDWLSTMSAMFCTVLMVWSLLGS